MKIRTTCNICGVRLIITEENEEQHRRGKSYYCQTHLEKTSGEEKNANRIEEERYRIYKEVIS